MEEFSRTSPLDQVGIIYNWLPRQQYTVEKVYKCAFLCVVFTRYITVSFFCCNPTLIATTENPHMKLFYFIYCSDKSICGIDALCFSFVYCNSWNRDGKCCSKVQYYNINLKCDSNNDICLCPYNRSSWVKIGGTVYKPDNTVAISSDLLPVFGKIIDVLIVSVTDCYFVCELLVTASFNSHYHAYETRQQRQPTQLVICKQQDLIDHHILGTYHVSNFTFVSLKYYLPENI